LKGVGRVYRQTVIDTYTKLGVARLYDEKTAITAAEGLNDRVVPFFDEHEIRLSRVLTDRGTEYCGIPQSHPYERYLALDNFDQTRTKARSPQTSGICERLNKTILQGFCRVALRKKLHRSIAELQADLDAGMRDDNTIRTHQGRWCYGKTPMQTFIDTRPARTGEVAAGRVTGHHSPSNTHPGGMTRLSDQVHRFTTCRRHDRSRAEARWVARIGWGRRRHTDIHMRIESHHAASCQAICWCLHAYKPASFWSDC
jgi:hypothetical protein